MSEQNKSVVRRYYELLDEGNLDGIAAICADNLSWKFTGQPEPLTEESLPGLIQGFGGAFPDIRHTLDSQWADGDWVVTPLLSAVHTLGT